MKIKTKLFRYFLCALTLSLAPNCFAQTKTAEPKATASDWAAVRLKAQISDWARARNWTKEYLDKMPETALGFKPVSEVRSFAGQMLHLAAANLAFGELVTGQPHPHQGKNLWNMPEPKSKAELAKFVLESYDYVLGALGKLDPARLEEAKPYRNLKLPGWDLLAIAYEHQTHHRGQVTIYLRLNGVTPPPEPF